MRAPRAARHLRLGSACAALVLAACAGTPRSPATATGESFASASAVSTAPTVFEQRLRERALAQDRQGRLAEAATSWEILTVLRPDSDDYRQGLQGTQRLIAAAVPERLQRAQLALKRGELDGAALQYLSVLSLQPGNAEAADALRQIERERTRRSQLGKASRLTIAQQRVAPTPTTPNPPLPLDRNELEHAAMLGTQGEYDDAIALLERHLAYDRRDVAACRLLADLYAQKAEQELGVDQVQAIAWFEKSLRLDATNVKALARVRQLAPARRATPATASRSPREACGASR